MISVLKKLFKIAFAVFIVFGISIHSYSQNIDSLHSALTNEKSESNISTLISLSEEYNITNPDTAYYYSQNIVFRI